MSCDADRHRTFILETVFGLLSSRGAECAVEQVSAFLNMLIEAGCGPLILEGVVASPKYMRTVGDAIHNEAQRASNSSTTRSVGVPGIIYFAMRLVEHGFDEKEPSDALCGFLEDNRCILVRMLREAGPGTSTSFDIMSIFLFCGRWLASLLTTNDLLRDVGEALQSVLVGNPSFEIQEYCLMILEKICQFVPRAAELLMNSTSIVDWLLECVRTSCLQVKTQCTSLLKTHFGTSATFLERYGRTALEIYVYTIQVMFNSQRNQQEGVSAVRMLVEFATFLADSSGGSLDLNIFAALHDMVTIKKPLVPTVDDFLANLMLTVGENVIPSSMAGTAESLEILKKSLLGLTCTLLRLTGGAAQAPGSARTGSKDVESLLRAEICFKNIVLTTQATSISLSNSDRIELLSMLIETTKGILSQLSDDFEPPLHSVCSVIEMATELGSSEVLSEFRDVLG
eukprot:GHVN01001602.1.p2 GENE.GHVN01001602.1~~GHVN01001602.1.p2  ORF type:complete len:455 (-),score=41.66 GHVN01001602.1:2278-3642(-)